MKPSARVRTIFDAVQWVLLAAVGLLGAAELVKTSRHMHDVLGALNGDDWNDGGWYFVSMAGSGVAVLALVAGFAVVQWRRGASYVAPFALLVSVIAADVFGEDLGAAAGRGFERADRMPFLPAYNWYPAALCLAVMVLGLYGTWRLARRTGAKA